MARAKTGGPIVEPRFPLHEAQARPDEQGDDEHPTISKSLMTLRQGCRVVVAFRLKLFSICEQLRLFVRIIWIMEPGCYSPSD